MPWRCNINTLSFGSMVLMPYVWVVVGGSSLCRWTVTLFTMPEFAALKSKVLFICIKKQNSQIYWLDIKAVVHIWLMVKPLLSRTLDFSGTAVKLLAFVDLWPHSVAHLVMQDTGVCIPTELEVATNKISAVRRPCWTTCNKINCLFFLFCGSLKNQIMSLLPCY